MAENTRYHALEEQIKKQDTCLQEMMEAMTGMQVSCQQKFQEELEQKSSRLEELVGNLDQRFSSIEQKFNNLLNAMMREKGCS